MVTTSTGHAGAERVVRSLALGLQDYEVEVAYLSGESTAFDLELEAMGIHVARLAGRRSRPFGLARRLGELLRARRPALVHSHLHHANVLASKVLAADQTVALIHTVHVIERRYRPLRPWLERRAAMRASRVACVSVSVAEHLRKSGWPADKLVTVPNGIDTAAYSSVPVLDLDGEPVIAGVGRLQAQKGFDLLLRAFARVAHSVPAARMEIAGVGPDAQSLAALAEKLGIAERVDWLGFRSDVAGVFASARVVAFPSRYEGFGLVLAEAGAAARPVVAFDLQTTREIVVPEETGRIVPAGDLDAFADSLAALLQDPESARRQGSAARLRIQRKFDEQQMVAGYASLYASLPASPTG
ncbi:MAG: glycosyltransferase [Planctomycetota bacterium]|nr:glycosyltransferase [Planctomycetota bacterium]